MPRPAGRKLALVLSFAFVVGSWRSQPQRWRFLLLLVPLLGASISECSSQPIRISVQPSLSTEDQPVHIAVTGLPPGQSVSLHLSSTDVDGVKWESSATYRAGASGDLSLDSIAPTSGSYSGVNGMGLISSMLPVKNQVTYTGYFWSNQQPLTFTLEVVDSGAVIASAKFQRRFSPIPVAIHSETLAADGFVGDYFAPETEGEHPAFLTFGGSEGGNSTFLLAALLAAHGYPSLALAYFGEPGLPQTLSNIPLEYFAKAVQWLDAQPGVDPDRVWVLGGSRGSEAALLLGVHYPQLVHGVIASSPGDAALCSYPDCSGPAWTLDGQPVPYTSQFLNPADDPAAIIPVEQIAGPAFLDCGGDDQVWTSCTFADAIMNRLNAAHDLYPHELEAYPEAGHGVDILVPYEPATAGPDTALVQGGTPDANQVALAEVWPQLLAFIQSAG